MQEGARTGNWSVRMRIQLRRIAFVAEFFSWERRQARFVCF
jgi:hypothetical protein